MGVSPTGSSYDNALLGTINGLDKTGATHPRKPWKTMEDVEIAAPEADDWFIHWLNHRRITQQSDKHALQRMLDVSSAGI